VLGQDCDCVRLNEVNVVLLAGEAAEDVFDLAVDELGVVKVDVDVLDYLVYHVWVLHYGFLVVLIIG